MATMRRRVGVRASTASIGSLEPGKKADLIAVRTDTPADDAAAPGGPYANLHHNLVHAVRGSDVDLVVIDGTVVVRDGRLVNADLAELIARARAAVPGLFARRAEYLAAHIGSLPAAFPATRESDHPSRGGFGRCGND